VDVVGTGVGGSPCTSFTETRSFDAAAADADVIKLKEEEE
jgi:hypothetical protein